MEQQKNLHVSIPPTLLVEVEKVELHITMDELLQDAVVRIVDELRQPESEPESEPFWKSFTRQIHALPDAVFERLPSDGASEHDHYLYGSPKRSA